ncbi:MAG: class I SAM-dependent methyltransferase [Hyphomonadaceae bacterium]|nr:class I SAM-dependent methyltransferase [Hyphomonadaceae bacterium]
MRAADWDRHADDFEDLVTDVLEDGSGRELDAYVAAVKPSQATSVLVDLGCGVGSFIRKYAGRFARAHGIDFAPRIVARAAALCQGLRGVSFEAMDAARAPEKWAGAADLTVSLNVITSPSAAKRKALWASVAGVAKPGGRALVVVPSIECYRMVERAEQSLGLFLQAPSKADGMAVRADAWQKHYEREELQALLCSLGFRVERLGKAIYPWSQEGLPANSGAQKPWDWICLAQKTR